MVKQHLTLVPVAPALFEPYAKHEMMLEQLMTFTVNLALLNRPVSGKHLVVAGTIATEGWTRMEVSLDLPCG